VSVPDLSASVTCVGGVQDDGALLLIPRMSFVAEMDEYSPVQGEAYTFKKPTYKMQSGEFYSAFNSEDLANC